MVVFIVGAVVGGVGVFSRVSFGFSLVGAMGIGVVMVEGRVGCVSDIVPVGLMGCSRGIDVVRTCGQAALIPMRGFLS